MLFFVLFFSHLYSISKLLKLIAGLCYCCRSPLRTNKCKNVMLHVTTSHKMHLPIVTYETLKWMQSASVDHRWIKIRHMWNYALPLETMMALWMKTRNWIRIVFCLCTFSELSVWKKKKKKLFLVKWMEIKNDFFSFDWSINSQMNLLLK